MDANLKNNIDYIWILNYLENNQEIKYSNPDSASDPTEKIRLEEIRKNGQKAVDELEKIVNLCSNKFELGNYSRNTWLDGSNTKTRRYLWVQMKYEKYKSDPTSISIFVEKGQGKAYYRISLEIKNDSADSVMMERYHSHLDMYKSNELIYVSGNNEWGLPEVINESQDEIRRKISDGDYRKVQICKIIEQTSEKTNEQYEKEILEAVESLIPYYEHVIGMDETSGMNGTLGVSGAVKNAKTSATEFDKNMILYGPPGTGKTYETAIYAVAICDCKTLDDVRTLDYEKIMERYNELKMEKRVVFTTFHQSYGYEEFIEGIKPVVDSVDNNIGYTKEDGIFKKFCNEARKKKIETNTFSLGEDAVIWKVTIRDIVKQDCYDHDRVRIDWPIDSTGAYGFVNDMKPGDIILTTNGSRKNINGIAIVKDAEAYLLNEASDNTTRDVEWLAKDICVDIQKINNGKQLHRMTCARVPNMNISDAIEIAKENNDALYDTTVVDNTKPYVFVIDEINRGNISKIFGELITLIEDTKREGKIEQASAILPYTEDSFSVPENVYILGTMNTADRSIALMDTALRRRFRFIEMMPKPEILIKEHADKVEDLDVAKMLEVINERITFLYDREHTIGHAFFMGLKNSPDIKTLSMIFQKSIIPLLQEYFYEDYQKIQLVLGDNGKSNPSHKFIVDDKLEVNSIFRGNPDDVIDLPEKKYTVNREACDILDSYKEII